MNSVAAHGFAAVIRAGCAFSRGAPQRGRRHTPRGNVGGTAAETIVQPSHRTFVLWGGFFVALQDVFPSHRRIQPMKELAKQYDPAQVEDRIYDFWQQSRET